MAGQQATSSSNVIRAWIGDASWLAGILAALIVLPPYYGLRSALRVVGANLRGGRVPAIVAGTR